MAKLLLAFDSSGMVWVRVRSRKAHKCRDCRTDILKGTDTFRPLTNGNNRMRRLCIPCVKAIARETRYAEETEQRKETEQ